MNSTKRKHPSVLIIQRARVEALKLQYESATFGGELHGDNIHMWFDDRAQKKALSRANWSGDRAQEPESLRGLLFGAVQRHGGRAATYRSLIDNFVSLALWALTRDASTAVAVQFAVEHVLDAHAMRALVEDDAACIYRDGRPWTHEGPTTCSTAYTHGDLARLRKLPTEVTRLFTSGTSVIQARWAPKTRFAGHECDPLRPPLESLAVAAHQAGTALRGQFEEFGLEGLFAEISLEPNHGEVLGIGLGLNAGPQALSVMLPNATIYLDAAPYHAAPIEVRAWDLVVLNVPKASAIEVAALLGNGSYWDISVREFGVCRAHCQRRNDARTDHVHWLTRRLVRHLRGGLRVIVLADDLIQHAVDYALRKVGLLPTDVVIASRNAPSLYVGSGAHARGTRGLPKVTGRLVTAWEVA